MANTTNEDTDYRTGNEIHIDVMFNQFLSESFGIGLHDINANDSRIDSDWVVVTLGWLFGND